ncbi:DUF4214 domain-containing protein [Muricoccus aerilatus]|uniref:DUF4214 domain-containing protein n=1 Tax=Muricoccus aerilatus TaxID=452982 RepID=UPI0006932124|nr:DUF4214 domain-containing protein [Roseomonas aerilata]
MGKLYFRASDGIHGVELAVTDGATTSVFDLNTDAADSNPGNFTLIGRKLFFTATTAANGTEVFVTDGTAQPRVIDALPGSGSSLPSQFTVFGNKLAYVATDGARGTELVVTDGTTTNFFDINPGSLSSSPTNLTPVGDRLFFTATTAAGGTEVFVTDGTTQPRIVDLFPGPATSTPMQLTAFGGKLAYVANDGTHGLELVITDGTVSSVFDIAPGATGSSPASLAVVGDKLFLIATTLANGTEVFVADGTSQPRVIDVFPGSGSSLPFQFTAFGNRLAYVATDGTRGAELVVTDGTTSTVFDVNTGTAGSAPTNLMAIGGKLFFTATTAANGTEVFVTNGTGQPRALDIFPGSTTSAPGGFTVFGSKLAFVATNGTRGAELVVTDGTTTTVFDVNTGAAGSSPANLTVVGDKLFFTANTAANGTEVFVTDGTASPRVVDVLPGPGSSLPAQFTVLGGRLAFVANDGARGAELIVTDGTTTSVFDVNPGAAGSAPTGLTVVGDKLFLTATTAANGTEIFVTDGTAQPRLVDVMPGSLGSDPALPFAAPTPATYSIAALSASKAEGNSGTTPFTFTVSRTGDVLGGETLSYGVAGSGASPADAQDFAGLAGTVSFLAGETSKVIAVGVRGDALAEANEGFTVTIAGSLATSIAQAAATGTILNDDAARTPTPTPTPTSAPSVYSLSALSAVKAEGSSGTTPFTFTVSRSGGSLAADTFGYTVAGSGARPADASDFVSLSGTVGFLAGETSKVISLGVRGDKTVERDEGFTLTLTGASLPSALKTSGTILNDDRPAAAAGQAGLLGTHDQYTLYRTEKGRAFVSDGVAGRDGGQDTAAGVFVFTDGVGLFDATGAGGHVYRLYQAAFDRLPDLSGQAYWTQRMDVYHDTLASIARSFTASTEFQAHYAGLSNQKVVQEFYRNVLGREGEASGVSYWTNQLNSGTSKADVLLGFSESIENVRNTASQAGDRDLSEAYRLYAAAFARTPDQPGLDYWTKELKAGATPIEVARNFTLSNEFKSLYAGANNAAIVDKLYQNVLGRAGEASGKSYWTAELDRGAPIASVLISFADGEENRANTAAQTHDNWIFIG